MSVSTIQLISAEDQRRLSASRRKSGVGDASADDILIKDLDTGRVVRLTDLPSPPPVERSGSHALTFDVRRKSLDASHLRKQEPVPAPVPPQPVAAKPSRPPQPLAQKARVKMVNRRVLPF